MKTEEEKIEYMSLFMQSFLLDAIEDRLVHFSAYKNTEDFKEWVTEWVREHQQKGK